MSVASFLIVFFLLNHIRKTLQSATKFPKLDIWLNQARYISCGMLAIQVVTEANALFRWLWPAVLVALVYFIYKRKELQPFRSIAVFIIPYIGACLIDQMTRSFFRDFYREYDDYFSAAVLFSFLAIVMLWYYSQRQMKALEVERIKRSEQEAQNRITEAQKDELEVLVAERTAALTRQKEELEKTLENLKSTQNQLIHAEKMASLGELTAGIAHEIQNPLNFVNNFSEVSVEMIDELREESEREEVDKALIDELLADIQSNLQKINYHGKRADRIVKGMLQHSRTSSGQKEETDINALADEYFRLAYHGLRAKDKTFNSKMIQELDPNLGKVSVLPQDLGRVMLNIFTNAFHAVTERKSQGVSGYDPTVSIHTQRVGTKVEIRIRDNGTGMPESVKQKIFQPFFTTKPTGQGTGLGLSLSYDIITKGHGGTLQVTSKEGNGTEFIITIPA